VAEAFTVNLTIELSVVGSTANGESVAILLGGSS
jgi:hypothetical protein